MAAALQHLVPHVLRSNHDEGRDDGHSSQGHYPPNGKQESQEDMQAHEEEKSFISSWEDHERTLSPSEVASDPEKKKVGHSSGHLRLDDFELVKTLGTGAHTNPLNSTRENTRR
jgi:protein kinase A